MILKKLLKPKLKLVNVKMAPKDIEVGQKKADKWTNGNFSELVRTAMLEWQPKPGDLAKHQSA